MKHLPDLPASIGVQQESPDEDSRLSFLSSALVAVCKCDFK